MKQFIYADNAATTKLDKTAFDAMIPWLTEEYGNASQLYTFARRPKKVLAEARQIIADAINASPEEIFFTSGGTESDNWAIKGAAFSDPLKRVTITSSIEHHAILKACAAIEELGYPVLYIPPDKNGVITSNRLKEIMTDNTHLVSIMLSNNEIGTIEPIQEMSSIVHGKGAIFHTDAVQAVGHIPIDVNNLGVDMLSASAHKFNGPKGIGFLFIRKGTELKPLNDGGAQEQGLRAGTENIAGIVGMATALKKNIEKIEENKRYVESLEQELLQGISSLDYIKNGSGNRIPGCISLSFKNADGEAIMHQMDLQGICISTGSACDSVDIKSTHVIQAIRVPEAYATGTVRITLNKDNTMEEVKKISTTLVQIINRLKTNDSIG